MVNSDVCCVPSHFLAMTVCCGQENGLREYGIHGLFSYSLDRWLLVNFHERKGEVKC